MHQQQVMNYFLSAEVAKEQGTEVHVEIYYHDVFTEMKVWMVLKWQKMGVMCVEMEAAGLYMNAARAEKCTCNTYNIRLSHKLATTSHERQVAFTK